ncbi:MAG: RNA methyltransferase [Chlamydiota bacterium]
MMNKLLISLQHPFVKGLVRLRKDRAFRREEKRVLVTGCKLVQELIESKAPVETLILEADFAFPSTIPTVRVTRDILKKITGLEEPEKVAAILSMPSFCDLSKVSYLLVLDGIADPGNLGTLLRTAWALGWEGVYLTENSCDPFNEKALRAAKGATFSIPLQEGTWEDFKKKSSWFKTFVADMEGTSLDLVKAVSPIALILSRESTGARMEAKEQFSSIKVPMCKNTESLNVAAAGAILLYELKRNL